MKTAYAAKGSVGTNAPLQESTRTPTPSATPTPSLNIDSSWILNPQNGHYYKLVKERHTLGVATQMAADYGGYLLTITTSEEQQFIEDTFLASIQEENVWLGMVFPELRFLYDPLKEHYLESSEWVTGEDVPFTNWEIDQPSGMEKAAELITEELSFGQWRINIPYRANYLIIERESQPVEDSAAPPVRSDIRLKWVVNPANGHYYTFVNKKVNWLEANDYALNRGGYLVTITDDLEQNFVIETYLGYQETFWIGLTSLLGAETDYEWWVTGEGSGLNMIHLWEDQYPGPNQSFVVQLNGLWTNIHAVFETHGFVIERDTVPPRFRAPKSSLDEIPSFSRLQNHSSITHSPTPTPTVTPTPVSK